MTVISWSIEGPRVINGNCAYGCPFQFAARPTDGTCKAVVGWRIAEGRYGETSLDGPLAVCLYAWRGAIHHGNGAMQSVIDERADDAQRKALAAVLQGDGAEQESVMLQIYCGMCLPYHAPLFKPIELELDLEGRTARLRVPGVVETSVEPIRHRVSGPTHRARIDLPTGKEFRIADVASGTTKAGGAIPLEFADTHAHFAYVPLTSGGLRA
jgi:hypothetical protein